MVEEQHFEYSSLNTDLAEPRLLTTNFSSVSSVYATFICIAVSFIIAAAGGLLYYTLLNMTGHKDSGHGNSGYGHNGYGYGNSGYGNNDNSYSGGGPGGRPPLGPGSGGHRPPPMVTPTQGGRKRQRRSDENTTLFDDNLAELLAIFYSSLYKHGKEL